MDNPEEKQSTQDDEKDNAICSPILRQFASQLDQTK